MANSTTCADGSLGPTINGCRGSFDFTLLFEQSFLSIAPSSIFLLLSIARLYVLLARKKRHVAGTIFQLSKLAAIAVYGAVQITLLVLWVRPGAFATRTSLSAAVLSFVDVFFLATLSWLEHAFSPRPSALISVYLLLSILFDAVQARTLWLEDITAALPSVFTASLALKVCLLVLESAEKGSFLSAEWKDRSPEEKSGIFSTSLMLWLRQILNQGRKRIISSNDLYATVEGLETSELFTSFWASWTSQPPGASPRSIVYVLASTLKWSLLAPVIPRVIQTALTICQALLLRQFLDYLGDANQYVEGAKYGFIAAYGLVYFGIAISTKFYWRLTYKCLVQMRGCLVAALYKKTTEIDTARYDMTAPVSLMSTDMERIIQGCKDLHEIWANTVQVGISIWLLYEQIGVACIAPAVVAIICCIGSFFMSPYADRSQVKWMEATQERVGATATAIASMKGVKLLGLSGVIEDMLDKLRAAELRAAKSFRYIEVLTATISFAPLLLSPVFTFMASVFIARSAGTRLDTTTIFTSLSLLQLMTQPLVWLLQAIPLFVASLGCLGRMGKYLQAPSQTDRRLIDRHGIPGESDSMSTENMNVDVKGDPENAVTIRNGTFGWIRDQPILKGVNVEIPKFKLTMVVGPVASGKTTLSKAMIGEIPYTDGQVRLNLGRSEVGYADQEPFLVNGTLEQNILGFSIFDSNWYDKVIEATGLAKDIAAMPEVSRTNIGSKGAGLSGGQRQRVAIARAIYAKTPLAIFDDVLSGLDAITREHVFRNVFGAQGLLHQLGSTAILFTHDVDLLPEADHIIALDKDGRVAASGPFAELGESSEYIKSLAIRQKSAAKEIEPSETVGVPPGLSFNDDSNDVEEEEDITRRLGDPTIYKYFFSHIGLRRMVVFVVFQCGWAVFSTFGPVWLKFWASANGAGSNRDSYYVGVYSAFQTLALIFLALFAGHTLTTMAVKAGRSLHGVTLKTVINAPMSFYSTVDTGVTTNRFSQDILLIDGELPMALLETVSAGLVALVQLVLIAFAAPYVAIAYPFVIALLYLVQSFYLRTSRQLRFLDLEAKSPLYTHFLETLHGLPTIRSFGWSAPNIELNHQLLDSSQQPLYLLYMVQRWLQLVLELIIAATAVVLIAVAVSISSTSQEFIGVALINLMSISQELKMIVINWTNLETSLGAIARTKQFEQKTPNENLHGETGTPPSAWPRAGKIQLESIYAVYNASEKANTAFENISVTINAADKVAICGRSGSGKSSLVMALARMLDLTSGRITIDGQDLATLKRSAVRSALNIVPQEPYFFHRTVSENLDPTGKSSAEAMQSALVKTQLWEVVEPNGGLDSELKTDILSLGQRQLLALARAILNPSRVVILDEATSNVDKHTGMVMQRVIREEFLGRTIIAIAHQLDTIVDFDRVLVMDAGRLVESGSPIDLMRREGSAFKRLCDVQGIRAEV